MQWLELQPNFRTSPVYVFILLPITQNHKLFPVVQYKVHMQLSYYHTHFSCLYLRFMFLFKAFNE